METLVANLVGKTRRERWLGRDYLVAPLTLIVPGVMSGSKGPLYYPPDEVAREPDSWNHVPIVVYHPTLNGTPTTARRPDVLERQGVGYVFNAGYRGKLRGEGWFDIERTKVVDPRVLTALEAGNPFELSTGLYTDNEPAPGGSVFNSASGPRPYTYIARNYRPDHLAVLPDRKGACSVADGCGVLVNELVDLDLGPVLVSESVGNAFDPSQARDSAGRWTHEAVAREVLSAIHEHEAEKRWSIRLNELRQAVHARLPGTTKDRLDEVLVGLHKSHHIKLDSDSRPLSMIPPAEKDAALRDKDLGYESTYAGGKSYYTTARPGRNASLPLPTFPTAQAAPASVPSPVAKVAAPTSVSAPMAKVPDTGKAPLDFHMQKTRELVDNPPSPDVAKAHIDKLAKDLNKDQVLQVARWVYLGATNKKDALKKIHDRILRLNSSENPCSVADGCGVLVNEAGAYILDLDLGPVSATNAKQLEGGRWVTVEGTHVYIKGGEIDKAIAADHAAKAGGYEGTAPAQTTVTSRSAGKPPETHKNTVPTPSPKAGRSFEDVDEADQWGARHYSDWASKLKSHEKEAVNSYIGPGFMDVNGFLRTGQHGGGALSKDKVAATVSGLNSALNKTSAPEDFVAYRGVEGDFAKKLVEAARSKGTLTDQGFMSMALSREVADEFLGSGYTEHSAVLQIHVPKGSKGAYIPLASDEAQGQSEWLAPAGSTLRLHGVSKGSGGVWHIKASLDHTPTRNTEVHGTGSPGTGGGHSSRVPHHPLDRFKWLGEEGIDITTGGSVPVGKHTTDDGAHDDSRRAANKQGKGPLLSNDDADTISELGALGYQLVINEAEEEAASLYFPGLDLLTANAFDPNQPRDKSGKWATVGEATAAVEKAQGRVSKAQAVLAKAQAALKLEEDGLLVAKKGLEEAKGREKARSPAAQVAIAKAGAGGPDFHTLANTTYEANERLTNRTTGLLPVIPRLYEEVRKEHPGLTEPAFHEHLKELQRRDLATQQVWDTSVSLEGVTGYPRERFPSGGRSGIFPIGWVQFHKDAGQRIKAALVGNLLTANKFNPDQPRDSKGRWMPASMAKGTGRTPSAAGQSAMVHAALGKKADVSSHVEAIHTLRSRGTDLSKEEIAAHVNRLGRHLNKAQVHDVARATGVAVAKTKKDTLAAIHQHLQGSSKKQSDSSKRPADKGAPSADFATRVVEAAKGLPNTFGHARDPGSEKWMGHKVYVSDLYDHLKPTLGGMGLKDFKQKLLEAHLGGKLTLLRDDIAGTRSHEAGAKHGASEIQHLNATFHTVDAHGKSTATTPTAQPEPHQALAKAVAGKQGFTGPFQRGPHTVVRHDDSGHTIEAEPGNHSGRFAVKDPSNVVHSRHDTAEAAVAAIHGVNRIGTSQGTVDKELRDRAAQTGKSATPDFHTLAATTHAANERLADPRTGLNPVIPRLYEEVRKEHPGLTEAAFHEHLKELERHDLATQQVWDTSVSLEGVTGYPRERFPSGGRSGIFPIGWVHFHKDAGSRIKAAQAGKSKAK